MRRPLSAVPEETHFLRADAACDAVRARLKRHVLSRFAAHGKAMNGTLFKLGVLRGSPSVMRVVINAHGAAVAWTNSLYPEVIETQKARKPKVGTTEAELIDAALDAGMELGLQTLPAKARKKVDVAAARKVARSRLMKGSFRANLRALEESQRGLGVLLNASRDPALTVLKDADRLADAFGLNARQAETIVREVKALVEAGKPTDAIKRAMKRRVRLALEARAEFLSEALGREAISVAQQALYQQAQAQGLLDEERQFREFVTRRDEKVCPICDSMDGQRTGIDEPFEADDGAEYTAPPVHPRCIPAGALVVPFGGVARHFTRWYEGELLVIRTASGKELPVTPNHPVLTEEGWVAAGALHVGSYILGSPSGDWLTAVGHMHNDDVPAFIQQVPQSPKFSRLSVGVEVKVSAEDFHGDGIGSDIAVIRTDRSLMGHAVKSGLLKHLDEGELLRAGESKLRLFGGGSLRHFFDALFAAGSRDVCSRCLRAALSLAHPAPFHSLGFALAPDGHSGFGKAGAHDRAGDSARLRNGILGNPGDVGVDRGLRNPLPSRSAGGHRAAHLDAELVEPLIDEGGGNSKLVSDLRSGLAGLVAPDKVTVIDTQIFRGHVYNLQTGSGAYWSNGILTHNCRCAVRLVTVKSPARGRAAA